MGTTVTLWLARKSSVARAVLKNFLTDVHSGQHLWCQNLISVSNGTKVARDVHQWSFLGVGYGSPHHHTSSAEIVDLKDVVPCEPRIPAL